ncbi:MAG: hypothetical protein M1838_004471 [Thelocarpon superellum]|nr:MAG: hypothetical protein M1838_004471 [Thelocarpon superellum]
MREPIDSSPPELPESPPLNVIDDENTPSNIIDDPETPSHTATVTQLTTTEVTPSNTTEYRAPAPLDTFSVSPGSTPPPEARRPADSPSASFNGPETSTSAGGPFFSSEISQFVRGLQEERDNARLAGRLGEGQDETSPPQAVGDGEEGEDSKRPAEALGDERRQKRVRRIRLFPENYTPTASATAEARRKDWESEQSPRGTPVHGQDEDYDPVTNRRRAAPAASTGRPDADPAAELLSGRPYNSPPAMEYPHHARPSPPPASQDESVRRLTRLGLQQLNNAIASATPQIYTSLLGPLTPYEVISLIRSDASLREALGLTEDEVSWRGLPSSNIGAGPCDEPDHSSTGNAAAQERGQACEGAACSCHVYPHGQDHKVCEACREKHARELEATETESLSRFRASTCQICARRELRAVRKQETSTCSCREALAEPCLCRTCRERTLGHLQDQADRRTAELLRTRLQKKKAVTGGALRKTRACFCGRAPARTQRQVMFCRACQGIITNPTNRTVYKPVDPEDDPREEEPGHLLS